MSPKSLVWRAASNGVSTLALTDHDEIGGLRPAAAAALEAGLILIPGVEISATWAGHTVHVLGLGIDPDNAQLAGGLAGQAAARVRRARRISERLSIVGITDAYPGAASQATESGIPGRAHFARHLAERGFARDMKAAFSRYLAHGKPGFVAPEWAPLERVLAWIHTAGGRAVLAHPDSYRFSPLQLHALLEQFKACGGDAIEYSAGSATVQSMLSRQALFFGFAFSAGSDFHAPTPGAADLGQVPPLPYGARAVWHDWDLPKKAA